MSPKLSPLTSRTVHIAEQAGDLAQFLGAITIPAHPVLVDGSGMTDWVLLDARVDPHFQANQLGMPHRCVRHLRKLHANNVDFDAILIGHELPPGTVAYLEKRGRDATGADLKTLTNKIGPPPTSIGAKRTAAIAKVTAKGITRAGAALGLLAGAVVLAPLAPIAAFGLDPVLFGVVTDDPKVRPGSLGALFYITSWINRT